MTIFVLGYGLSFMAIEGELSKVWTIKSMLYIMILTKLMVVQNKLETVYRLSFAWVLTLSKESLQSEIRLEIKKLWKAIANDILSSSKTFSR